MFLVPNIGWKVEATASSVTSLLLHCDGTDGSTTFTDSSPSAHTVTAGGNAQVDTAQSKFGGASALFDGTGDYISVPHNAVFDFGAGDFCVEAWIRPSVASNFRTLVQKRASGVGRAPFWFNFNTDAVGCWFSYTGAAWDVQLTSPGSTVTINTWQHVAVTREGSAVRLFHNGVLVDSDTLTGALMTNSDPVLVGGGNGVFEFAGHMDEVRIVKGAAVYTAAFTPPSSPYS